MQSFSSLRKKGFPPSYRDGNTKTLHPTRLSPFLLSYIPRGNPPFPRNYGNLPLLSSPRSSDFVDSIVEQFVQHLLSVYTVIIHGEYIRLGKMVSIVATRLKFRCGSSPRRRSLVLMSDQGRGREEGGFECGTRTCNKWNVSGLLILTLACVGEERNSSRRCIEFI